MLTRIYNGFVKVLGDIKVFPYPLFIIYDPGSYKIKGDEMREVMQRVEPGDILVRGYVNYLDGYLIPGFFSHAGLYLGKVDENDKRFVRPQAMHLFRTGEQMVIHAMAEGVFMEDVLNFCRCDYMIILRRNPAIESQTARQITFRQVFEHALQQLGTPYDFQFNFSDIRKLSCTELVYDCCKDFITEYGIQPQSHRFLFFTKTILSPDDFVISPLQKVWRSRAIPRKALRKLGIDA